MNSRLWDQKRRSDNQRCCSRHVEQSVDGGWWIADAGDQQCRTLERSNRWGTSVLDSWDTSEWLWQACTPLANGCQASAVHCEVALTDHGCTCWYRKSDMLRHSVLAAAHQWSSSTPRPGLSYSSPMRDVTKAWTSIFSDSVSNERRTRLSWRSPKKHVLQTIETCLSRLRSAAIMTPSNRTWSLALMTSAPSWSDGAQPPNVASLCLEPTQRSSVLSAFSFRRLADIQWPTSEIQSSSLRTADDIPLSGQCK